MHSGEDFTSEGDVSHVQDRYFSVGNDDEDCVMKSGELRIWHMVFVSNNKFYWVVGPSVSKKECDGVVNAARIRCQPSFS